MKYIKRETEGTMRKRFCHLSKLVVLSVFLALFVISSGAVTRADAATDAIIYARPLLGQLDPGTSGASEAVQNMFLLYDTLIMIDGNGNIIPGLAEKWDISEDYKTFTFHLRKGVTFHDGAPFTANDVKFSYDRVLRVKRTSFGNYLKIASLDSCTVVDDHTLKIELTVPSPNFLIDATAPSYAVVNSEYVKKHMTDQDPEALKWMTENGNGTGPYALVKNLPGQKIQYKRNDNYWGGPGSLKSVPKTEKLVFIEVKDSSTARLMLEKGDVDIVEKLTVEQFEEVGKNENLQVGNFEVPTAVYLTADVSKPPFDDPAVRKAISHAINYQEIITYIEKDNVTRLAGMIPKGIMGHNSDLKPYDFDAEKAGKLLKGSQHADGLKTQLVFAMERRAEFEQVAAYIQSYLSEIGITTEIQKIAFDAQIAKMEKGDYGLSLMYWTCVLPDPDDVVGWLYDAKRASGGWNGAFWPDENVMGMMKAGREMADQKERQALYMEADKIASENAIYFPLYQLTKQVAFRKGVENVNFDPLLKINFWDIIKK
jgi:peptide/nickel transport system substrate-binding protein